METNASVSKQARLRGGMAWILSFLLCLFLTVLSLLSLLECTLLSPGFLKKQVDKSAYTAHVIEDMEDIFVSYGISSDFDEAFFTSVLTEEEVRADIYAEIDRLYAADATGADYGAFESQLYDKLTANVKERNLEITESVDQALHYLAQMCVNLILTVSPQRIVLGGGVMQRAALFPMVRAETLRLLGGYVQSPAVLEHIDEYIVAPALFPVSGLVGSYLIGKRALEERG